MGEGEREIDRDRQREKERDTERDTQTDRQRQRGRKRGGVLCVDWAFLEDHGLEARQTDEILDLLLDHWAKHGTLS